VVWVEVTLGLEITEIQIDTTINNLISQDIDDPSLGNFRRYTSKEFVFRIKIVNFLKTTPLFRLCGSNEMDDLITD
jgi:hypothetical protein